MSVTSLGEMQDILALLSEADIILLVIFIDGAVVVCMYVFCLIPKTHEISMKRIQTAIWLKIIKIINV